MKRVPFLLSSSVLVLLAGQAVDARPGTDTEIAARIERVSDRLRLLSEGTSSRFNDPLFKQVQYFGNWDNWGDEDEPIWNNWDNFGNFDNYHWDSY